MQEVSEIAAICVSANCPFDRRLSLDRNTWQSEKCCEGVCDLTAVKSVTRSQDPLKFEDNGCRDMDVFGCEKFLDDKQLCGVVADDQSEQHIGIDRNHRFQRNISR